MKRTFCIGGSAPKPPGFIAFSQPEWFTKGGGAAAPWAIPAAETVARVASQHCPIPSGSGTISLQQISSAGYGKPANGNLSPFTLSHRWGSLQRDARFCQPDRPGSITRGKAGTFTVFAMVFRLCSRHGRRISESGRSQAVDGSSAPGDCRSRREAGPELSRRWSDGERVEVSASEAPAAEGLARYSLFGVAAQVLENLLLALLNFEENRFGEPQVVLR